MFVLLGDLNRKHSLIYLTSFSHFQSLIVMSMPDYGMALVLRHLEYSGFLFCFVFPTARTVS